MNLKTLFIATLIAIFAVLRSHADIVIYPVGPVVYDGCSTGTGCPGGYCAHLVYSRTISQGWGWAVDTNNYASFYATDTNRNDTKIQLFGKSGDNNCDWTTAFVVAPPHSAVYRFTVYFQATNGIVGTNYPLTLHGFNP